MQNAARGEVVDEVGTVVEGSTLDELRKMEATHAYLGRNAYGKIIGVTSGTKRGQTKKHLVRNRIQLPSDSGRGGTVG